MAKKIDRPLRLALTSATTTADANYPRDGLSALLGALATYFDLMYDCDTSRFDEVFFSTAHLHGYRDGEVVSWSAPVYRAILEKRQSPKSFGAPRLQEVLLIDFVSTDMAFVKVRVRINKMIFVDYLTWHRFVAKWLITSKGFHLESEDPAPDGESRSPKNSASSLK